ncbi:MAG TPA: LamG domain-containing protein, partial [Verrucomicrobiae bacterium]
VVWVQLSSTANWARVFDFGNSTTAYMFLAPQNGTSGTLRFGITTNSAGGEQQINCSRTLSTGAWHQLAVTQSNSLGVLYLDGTPVGTNSALTLKPSSLGTTTNNYLGKSQWADPYLNGQLEEVRVYGNALTAEEIAAMYALGSQTLLSTNPPVAAALVANGQFNLSWPAANPGYRLQTNPDLTDNGWVTLTGTIPLLAGNNYQISWPVTNRSQFFRLIK